MHFFSGVPVPKAGLFGRGAWRTGERHRKVFGGQPLRRQGVHLPPDGGGQCQDGALPVPRRTVLPEKEAELSHVGTGRAEAMRRWQWQ